MYKILNQVEFYPTHRSVSLATVENSKYDKTVLDYKTWCFFILTSSVIHTWKPFTLLNHYQMWASSKHNSDVLAFRNKNIGCFSTVGFHERNILRDFAMICFRQNTQLKKYCMYFLRRKMIETRLTRSSHKILHSFQVLSSNSKILRKFELNVNCLSNFLEWFSKSFLTH